MKKVWIVREDSHGVIGIAKNLSAAREWLVFKNWLSVEETNPTLFATDKLDWIQYLEKEHGIFLEKIKMWE